MSASLIEGVRIEALCASVPKNTIKNSEAGRELYGDALDNIIVATGVENRRVLKNSRNTAVELSIHAAEKIFSDNRISREDIGGVLFVTFSPANIMPNNATLCQHLLGLEKAIPAFDINLACSGYPYGLWTAAMMAKALNKKVLLLDGDKQSHFVSPYDKATAILFSDAGSATVVSPDGTGNRWFFDFYSDGGSREALIIKHGGSKEWFCEESLSFVDDGEGSSRRATDLYMNGLDVFKFVTMQLPRSIKKILEETQTDKEGIDYFVFHQANRYMLMQVAKMLKIDRNKVPLTIDKYGNSSSATIPVTIASELADVLSADSKRIVLAGFGAGLSIGTALIDAGPFNNLGIIEFEE